MALGSNPSHIAITGEFASSSLPSNKSMVTLYNAVFSGGAGSHSKFANKAQATVTGSLDVSRSSTDVVSLTVSLTAGGVPTTVIGEYKSAVDSDGNELATPCDDGTDPNCEEGWSTLDQITVTTDGSHTVSAVPPTGRWFFRVRVYNGFISHPADQHQVYESDQTRRYDIDYSPAEWPGIGIKSCSNNGGNEATAVWYYAENPTSFEAEIRVTKASDGSVATYTGSYVSDTNWGSVDNDKIGTWSIFAFFDPNDKIEIRIRAAAQGSTAASKWSHSTLEDWCISYA